MPFKDVTVTNLGLQKFSYQSLWVMWFLICEGRPTKIENFQANNPAYVCQFHSNFLGSQNVLTFLEKH